MNKRTLALSLLATLTIGVFSGCKSTKTIPIDQRKIEVVCTIGMITDIATQIGGDRATVQGLMGPGVDPHLYRASEGDVRKLSNADLIFYNGLHLEAKMGEVLESISGKTKTIAVSRSIPETLLHTPPEFKGTHDPHIWFDVTLWILATKAIRDGYCALDPTHKDGYTTRADAVIKKLHALDAEIKTLIQEVPAKNRILVTAHDAFGYFGSAYGFQVIGLQGISTESEAGTRDVQRLAQFIADKKIPAVFVETSIPKRTIQAVQEAVAAKGWTVKIGGELYSDAMGNKGTEEGHYIGMVRHNTKTIVNGLKR